MKNIYKILLLLIFILIICINYNIHFVEKFWNSVNSSGGIELVSQNNYIKKSKIDIFQRENGFIIKNGNIKKTYLSSYGWSCFLIYYSDILIYEVCYFKKNNNNHNNHTFIFDLKDSIIQFDLKIDGNYEKSMTYFKAYKNDSIYYLNNDREIFKKKVNNK